MTKARANSIYCCANSSNNSNDICCVLIALTTQMIFVINVALKAYMYLSQVFKKKKRKKKDKEANTI